MWYKPNVCIGTVDGLCQNFENFTIGFHNKEGGHSLEHSNFSMEESNSNVVVADNVAQKWKHNGDRKKVVNMQQKP